MSRAAGLARGRAKAERLMTDACTITRPGAGGPGPIDPETGQYADPARVTIYTGKCRIQIKSIVASASDSDAGDRQGAVQEVEWQGPVVGTEAIAINDVIHMNSSASDAALVAREFTVTARHEKSQATARRLRVIEGTA